MSWLQLQWQLRSDQIARAEALLNDHGAVAVVLESLADEVVLEPDPGATPMWTEVHLKAFFPLDLNVAALGIALKELDPEVHGHCEFDFVAEQDWQAAVQKHAVEQQFGGRLWLLPKAAQKNQRRDAACLFLDPGLAFGSGSHPTTRMCLSWMAGAIKRGQRVLDFGCGSGILAIAAALLGSPKVLLLDEPFNGLDPVASQAFARLIRKLATKGVSVVVSSHMVAQLEGLIDRVALIHRGQLLDEGPLADVEQRLGLNGRYAVSGEGEVVPTALADPEDIVSFESDDSGWTLTVRAHHDALLQRALKANVVLKSWAPVRPNLVEWLCAATGMSAEDVSLEVVSSAMLPMQVAGVDEDE